MRRARVSWSPPRLRISLSLPMSSVRADTHVMLAQVSVHAADVKRIFSSFSIQVNASTEADLKEDEIVVRLRKAGGASYDRV
jgi:hypothetical protein